MLVELAIFPLGRGCHTSSDLAEVLKVIDQSGLAYMLTPSGTCIEGSWEEVMPVVRRCHELMRSSCTHVVTDIRIEDDADSGRKLRDNIRSVERAAGRRFCSDMGLVPVSERDEIC